MSETRPAAASWAGGAILIALGLVLLAGELFTLSPWMVLASISAVLLALWAATRQYGFAVPAMIVAGLAVGTGWQDALVSSSGGEPVVGLALGFIGIYVVNLFARREAQWWPLVPGGILAAVGGQLVAQGTVYESWILPLWPVALIVLGLVLLYVTYRRGGAAQLPKT